MLCQAEDLVIDPRQKIAFMCELPQLQDDFQSGIVSIDSNYKEIYSNISLNEN